MSPNFAFAFVAAVSVVIALASLFLWILGCDEREPFYKVCSVFCLAVAVVTFVAGWELHDFATGKTHYEKLDNPDGTKTWQRVEVTK